MNGDIKGAIAYMCNHEEFKGILPVYVAIFEVQKYRTYEIPDNLSDMLRLYQIYFRDAFFCGLPQAKTAEKLMIGLRALLNMRMQMKQIWPSSFNRCLNWRDIMRYSGTRIGITALISGGTRF